MSLPSPQLNDKGQTIADAAGNEVTDYFPSESTKQKRVKTQDQKGVAQKTRGTLLGKQDLKRHGEQILEGATSHEKDRLQ